MNKCTWTYSSKLTCDSRHMRPCHQFRYSASIKGWADKIYFNLREDGSIIFRSSVQFLMRFCSCFYRKTIEKARLFKLVWLNNSAKHSNLITLFLRGPVSSESYNLTRFENFKLYQRLWCTYCNLLLTLEAKECFCLLGKKSDFFHFMGSSFKTVIVCAPYFIYAIRCLADIRIQTQLLWPLRTLSWVR